MNDTTKEVEDRYLKMILAQPPDKRLAMACSMFTTAKKLIMAYARRKELEFKETYSLRQYIFMRFYGQDFDSSERRKILNHLKVN